VIWFVDLPLVVRILLLLPIGVAAGSVINWAIYRLAYDQRSISPWSSPPNDAPPRKWTDRIPIVGWLGLRREAKLHGNGFWIRPLLIEIGSGLSLAALYWWDISSGAYLGYAIRVPGLVAGMPVIPSVATAAHLRFLAQAVLLFFMAVATFIDIDEKTIPDAVSVTGTWIGLLLAAIFPWSQLTHVIRPQNVAGLPQFGVVIDGVFSKVVTLLTFASPNAPPAGLASLAFLLIGIACLVAWRFSLLDRRWNPRLPLRRAAWLFFARAMHGGLFWRSVLMAIVGTIGIVIVWQRAGIQWLGLFNALLGMAVGGGIVWAVRIIGRVALKKEAMGFGDVTLMAMIGTFVGWQACLFIFFIAPFAGLVVGVAQFIFNRDDEIPYGPFLCMATVVVVLEWARIWKAMYIYFQLPLLIPAAMAVCLVLMLGLLGLFYLIKKRMGWIE
jgi:leader peptidase (prepilin peptidase)/N-methyltransferase